MIRLILIALPLCVLDVVSEKMTDISGNLCSQYATSQESRLALTILTPHRLISTQDNSTKTMNAAKEDSLWTMNAAKEDSLCQTNGGINREIKRST